MTDASTDLVIPEDERAFRGLELAELHFPIERRQQIAAFLEIPAEDPAMLPYLAWCAGNRLSPISGHVWLIPKKIKGRDGNPDRTIYKPAIGRDGLLHKARETKGKAGGYKGMQFGVVCEHDTFEVEYTGDMASDPQVLHRFASKPTQFPAGVAPDRYRGRVIGAWAKCLVDGEPPTFYYANLREHGRLRQVWDYNPAERTRKPLYFDEQGRNTFAEFAREGQRHKPVMEWEGAWDYTSTMVLKAAQSYVLRIALGLTGVVPVDELRDAKAWSENDAGADGAPSAFADETLIAEFDFEKVPESVRERLREAVQAANDAEPYSWAPAKCEMVFTGRREEELEELAAQIEAENTLREERRVAAEVAAEEIVDAEIVGDDPPAEDAKPAAGKSDRRMELEASRVDLLAAIERAPDADALAKAQAELDQVEAELRQLGA